ncbi:MAG: hypothetical protein KDB01_18615, partial [Planctomycetaceae bacterium]|nr:hypothetical protein [Planctomycetaceae bacterium]
ASKIAAKSVFDDPATAGLVGKRPTETASETTDGGASKVPETVSLCAVPMAEKQRPLAVNSAAHPPDRLF